MEFLTELFNKMFYKKHFENKEKTPFDEIYVDKNGQEVKIKWIYDRKTKEIIEIVEPVKKSIFFNIFKRS